MATPPAELHRSRPSGGHEGVACHSSTPTYARLVPPPRLAASKGRGPAAKRHVSCCSNGHAVHRQLRSPHPAVGLRSGASRQGRVRRSADRAERDRRAGGPRLRRHPEGGRRSRRGARGAPRRGGAPRPRPLPRRGGHARLRRVQQASREGGREPRSGGARRARPRHAQEALGEHALPRPSQEGPLWASASRAPRSARGSAPCGRSSTAPWLACGWSRAPTRSNR